MTAPTEPPVTHAELLTEAVHALVDELHALTDLPPVEAARVLGGWVNRMSPHSYSRKLAGLRRLAALAAVDELGTQVAVARQLGMAEASLSHVVTGNGRRG